MKRPDYLFPSSSSRKEKLDRARAKSMALGKPTGGPSKATRDRIQAAIEQEERTRRNIEALNYEGDKDD